MGPTLQPHLCRRVLGAGQVLGSGGWPTLPGLSSKPHSDCTWAFRGYFSLNEVMRWGPDATGLVSF